MKNFKKQLLVILLSLSALFAQNLSDIDNILKAATENGREAFIEKSMIL